MKVYLPFTALAVWALSSCAIDRSGANEPIVAESHFVRPIRSATAAPRPVAVASPVSLAQPKRPTLTRSHKPIVRPASAGYDVDNNLTFVRDETLPD